MILPPVVEHETERLAALDRYAILDTSPEEAFDEIAKLASSLCDAPIALISLIDGTRQWFKSRVGMAATETSRDISFCAHAIVESDLCVVTDTLADPRFADNPLVTAEPRIRFYAGAPLTTPEGLNLGTLCVIDRKPRVLTAEQCTTLRALARQVMVQLELRRQIAERSVAEVKLRESQRSLQRVLDGTNDGFWDWNVASGDVQYSARSASMLGYTLEEFQPHVMTWISLVHAKDLPRVMSTLDEHLRGDSESYESDYRMRCKDGSWVWVLDRGRVVSRDRDGAALRMAGTRADISRRRKAERELDRFFDVSLDLLCIASFDGYFTRLNPAFEEVLGYTLEELVATPLVLLVHPDDRAATQTEIESLREGRTTIHFENRYLHKDGSIRWIAWTASPSPDEELIYAAGRDITRAKAAEDELRRSESRTRSILDNALGSLVATDAHGVIESVNDAAERTFGYAAAELMGRTLDVLVVAPIAQLRDAGRGRVTECRGRRKNGEVFTCEVSVFEFYASDDHRHFAAHILDVSERHEVERMKKDFISTVSHELRTPLTSIRGSLGLLASGVLGELPEDARPMVSVAERNSVRLISLINDILDFDKLESGKMVMDLQPTPLLRVLERSIESVSTLAVQDGVSIELHCANAMVIVDEARMGQVVVNLLSNAVKYSHRGGVVRVSAILEDGWAEVRIEDHGRGIAAELQPKLFRRFQRVDSSDARTKPGTGLGLAICKAIVEQHDGTIGLQSREGEGSTFWFRIRAAGMSAIITATGAFPLS